MQGDGVTIRDSIGREQHSTIINESGLYSLVPAGKPPQTRPDGRASSPARVRAYKEWIKIGAPVPDST